MAIALSLSSSNMYSFCIVVLTIVSIVTAGPSERKLPDGSLILGYATQCNGKVLEDAIKGVNVINWFAVNLASDDHGEPVIQYGLNTTCIAMVAKELRDKGLATSHIITIGGWDAPHPITTWTGQEWFETWKSWNQDVVARTELGFDGFDGFDWDLEGNDAPSNPANHFTKECMELVGVMSQQAKDAGFIVTMVPPESYLDVSTHEFDLSLRHPYPEWHPEFLYHGRNAYAILLSKYAKTPGGKRTFDLVDIQLYESYAHAAYQINIKTVPAHEYLVKWMTAVLSPFHVHFSPLYPDDTILISPDQLVVGFSFGSAGTGKTVFITPNSTKLAFESMPPNMKPRGVMFWNIALDNEIKANGTNKVYDFATDFNKFLHTRK